jgi:hypothetical protein
MVVGTNPCARGDSLASTRSKACDACHYRKQKCTFAGKNTACSRCIRRRRDCVFERPAPISTLEALSRLLTSSQSAKAFRLETKKPLAVMNKAVRDDMASELYRPLNPFGDTFAHLGEFEQQTIERLYHKSNFMQYFIGPTFVDGMQRDMIVQLLSMFDTSKDSYIAMYSAFASGREAAGTGNERDDNLRRGVSALQKLRSCQLPSLKPAELLPWVGFGLGVVYFSNCAIGTNATPVRRYILGHVRELTSSDTISGDFMHSILVYLLAVETNECLLRRQVPVCGIGIGEPGLVDAYLGLSIPLFQLLFELAKVSHAMSQDFDRSQSIKDLDRLERDIRDWVPEPQPDFASRFTTTEVVHILAQSHAYKSMGLLFILRLRYDFGSQDEAAHAIATSILTGLRFALEGTKEAPRYVSMPYLIAAIEARDSQEREWVLKEVDIFVDTFSPKLQRNMKAFLEALWQIRDNSTNVSWLDLVGLLPPIYGSV